MKADAQGESSGDRRTVAFRSAVLMGDAMPAAVLVAPWGDVRSASGDFVVDEESARLVVAAFESHGTDLPIDYEHQTLGGSYAAPDGKAPAAGWIRRLEARPGVGLLAHIEWTPPAEALLRTRQYRYLSPVAVIRKDDRRMVALHSCALTNKPAIVGMVPITGSTPPEDAVDPLTALRARLALSADADAAEVLVAASSRLAALDDEASARRADELVREAICAGRLTEAQRGWAQRLVLRDAGLFEEFVRSAPAVMPIGMTVAPHRDGAEGLRRSAESRARAEYRSSPLLQSITSEEAYVRGEAVGC
jgi:phage I-like protein